jgi:hypothetical protein
MPVLPLPMSLISPTARAPVTILGVLPTKTLHDLNTLYDYIISMEHAFALCMSFDINILQHN